MRAWLAPTCRAVQAKLAQLASAPEERTAGPAGVSTITWRGTTYPVRAERMRTSLAQARRLALHCALTSAYLPLRLVPRFGVQLEANALSRNLVPISCATQAAAASRDLDRAAAADEGLEALVAHYDSLSGHYNEAKGLVRHALAATTSARLRVTLPHVPAWLQSSQARMRACGHLWAHSSSLVMLDVHPRGWRPQAAAAPRLERSLATCARSTQRLRGRSWSALWSARRC